MEGKKFSSSKRVVIYVRDMLERYQADALRYFVAAAGPGEPGRRLHLGGVRPPHQRRARRRLGQPGQPHRDHDREELRRDPRAGELTAEDTALLDQVEQAFVTVGDLVARHRQKAAIGEAMRTVVGGEQVRLRPGAVEAQGRRPARAARHRPARDRPVRGRLQRAPRAVPARLGRTRSTACSAAAATSRRCRGSRRSTTSTGARAYPIITGDYPQHARLGPAPADRGHPDRQADAGLHQARPGGRRRGARPARGCRVRRRPLGSAQFGDPSQMVVPGAAEPSQMVAVGSGEPS